MIFQFILYFLLDVISNDKDNDNPNTMSNDDSDVNYKNLYLNKQTISFQQELLRKYGQVHSLHKDHTTPRLRPCDLSFIYIMNEQKERKISLNLNNMQKLDLKLIDIAIKLYDFNPSYPYYFSMVCKGH